MKRKYAVIGVLLVAVVAATLLVSSMLLHTSYTVLQSQQSADVSQTPADLSNLNNGASLVGPRILQLDINSSELYISRGSTIQGTIPINILKADPIRIFIDDGIFNTTKPTTPEGLTISAEINGESISVPSITSIPNPASTEALQTSLGKTSIQYTISASKDVPAGKYNILLSIQSWLSDGTKWEYGIGYEVILHVQ